VQEVYTDRTPLCNRCWHTGRTLQQNFRYYYTCYMAKSKNNRRGNNMGAHKIWGSLQEYRAVSQCMCK
jgi:hypothetical protein